MKEIKKIWEGYKIVSELDDKEKNYNLNFSPLLKVSDFIRLCNKKIAEFDTLLVVTHQTGGVPSCLVLNLEDVKPTVTLGGLFVNQLRLEDDWDIVGENQVVGFKRMIEAGFQITVYLADREFNLQTSNFFDLVDQNRGLMINPGALRKLKINGIAPKSANERMKFSLQEAIKIVRIDSMSDPLTFTPGQHEIWDDYFKGTNEEKNSKTEKPSLEPQGESDRLESKVSGSVEPTKISDSNSNLISESKTFSPIFSNIDSNIHSQILDLTSPGSNSQVLELRHPAPAFSVSSPHPGLSFFAPPSPPSAGPSPPVQTLERSTSALEHRSDNPVNYPVISRSCP